MKTFIPFSTKMIVRYVNFSFVFQLVYTISLIMASVIGNIGLLLTKQITIIGFSLKLLTKKSDVGEKVNKSLFYKIK